MGAVGGASVVITGICLYVTAIYIYVTAGPGCPWRQRAQDVAGTELGDSSDVLSVRGRAARCAFTHHRLVARPIVAHLLSVLTRVLMRPSLCMQAAGAWLASSNLFGRADGGACQHAGNDL